MNKTKIILAATGGVIALIVLVSAYFAWDASARKRAALEGDSEGLTTGLEEMARKVRSYLAKKPYPCTANVELLNKNSRALAEWRLAARRLAARGDWCEDESISPAQFKEMIISEARVFLEREGKAENGKFMKPDFGFGPFQPYLADVLPPKDQLPRLQRQWYDITALCELLASNGVYQVLDIRVVEPKRKESAKAAAPAKGNAGGRQRDSAESDKADLPPSVMTYEIVFAAEPKDFTAIVRKLSSRDRFTVIDDFSFFREQDVLTERLGKNEKQESASTSGRRRRRAAAVKEEKPKEDAKAKAAKRTKGADRTPAEPERKAIRVFDPAVESVLTVQLTVSVYDFRSLEKESPAKGADGKGASK